MCNRRCLPWVHSPDWYQAVEKACVLHLPTPAHSISEPPPAPVSRMSREGPRPQRHLLGFSEPGPAHGIEPLQEAAQGPEEQQPSPAGKPSFR